MTARRARATRPVVVEPGARVAAFAARYQRHSRGASAGEPFVLERWQRTEIIDPLFGTLDRRGCRIFREALIGMGRGNGKSPLGSLIANYGLFAEGVYGAECYALAASKEQARIVFGEAKASILSSPMLAASSKVYRDAIEVPETGSVFRVLSSLAGLAHGLIPYVTVVDELHAHRTLDLYEAIQSALHKLPNSLLVAITTAGPRYRGREPTPLWQLYQRAVEGLDPRLFFRWWAGPDGCSPLDAKAIRAANPLSTVKIADVRAQAKAMLPGREATYRQLHLNQFFEGTATWIDMSLWDACAGRPLIPVDAPVYIAVDAAPKKDTTAVVVVHRDPETGRHRWWRRRFTADRIMGYLDFVEVEEYLRECCRTWDVRRIAFDPFTMMRSMIELAGEGLPVEEFPQNDARMVPASQTLYDLIQEARLEHDGTDELRAEAAGAVAVETARGWRLHKLRSSVAIDGLVAGAMASHLAELDAQHGRGLTVYVDDDDLDDDDLDDLDDEQLDTDAPAGEDG